MTQDIFEGKKTLQAFCEKNGYFLGDVWLPRVTSVLDIIAKPSLLRFYAQHRNFTSAQENIRCAAEMGIRIHEACESILMDADVNVPKELEPLLVEFEAWRHKHEVEVLAVEKKIFDIDEHFFCGTADVLAKIDGEVGILDIKTGTGIWDEYSLQTAAYLKAHNKLAKEGEKASVCWILRLDQYQRCEICNARRRVKEGNERITGGKNFCKHKFSENKAEFEFKKLKNIDDSFKVFLHAKELWEWQNRSQIKQIKNYPKNLLA